MDTSVGLRHWILLGVVTIVALLLLWGAASMPAICAAVDPPMGSCTQEARVLPATIGALVIVGLAVVTALVARLSRRRRVEGVSRSEGIIALGTMAIGVVGVVAVIVVLFSAGFRVL